MYSIKKEFSACCAHSLKHLPEDHPCTNLHGHNYVFIFELRSYELDNVGFVMDYRALDPIKKYINEKLDHRNLNDILKVNPSAENIAHFLYEKFIKDFPLLYSVTVKETGKTEATFIKNY